MKTSTIFVYGTLSFDEIISELLDRKMEGKKGRISGFKRVKIIGKRYPGLVAVGDRSSVIGRVHEGINEDELGLLDTFEDDFYQKAEAEVQLDNGKIIKALVYIVPKQNLEFAAKEKLDRRKFGQQHTTDYIEMVKKFRKNYLSGERKHQEF